MTSYEPPPLFVRLRRPSRLVQLEHENAALKVALSDALDLIDWYRAQEPKR